VRPSSIHKLRPGGNLFWPDIFLFCCLLHFFKHVTIMFMR
jgi:hypothetical protein